MTTAIVTGASSGIGASFAERLAARGHSVVLVARRRDRLEALAAKLQKEHRIEPEVLVADLTRDQELARVEARAARGDVALVVNNAGFGGYKPFVEVDPRAAEELVRIHVLAVVRLSRAVLPGMVERKSGAIINVASLLAVSGALDTKRLPYRAVYAGGKAFLFTFTRALHSELATSGVKVQVCMPGLVATEFHSVQGASRPPVPPMSAEDVVTASLGALERGDVVCAPGIEDATLFDRLNEAERAIFVAASPNLATRYR